MRALVATGSSSALELREVAVQLAERGGACVTGTTSQTDLTTLQGPFDPSSDLTLLADEIGAGRLSPQLGHEASWRDPLEALRDQRMQGNTVLSVD